MRTIRRGQECRCKFVFHVTLPFWRSVHPAGQRTSPPRFRHGRVTTFQWPPPKPSCIASMLHSKLVQYWAIVSSSQTGRRKRSTSTVLCVQLEVPVARPYCSGIHHNSVRYLPFVNLTAGGQVERSGVLCGRRCCVGSPCLRRLPTLNYFDAMCFVILFPPIFPTESRNTENGRMTPLLFVLFFDSSIAPLQASYSTPKLRLFMLLV